MPTSCPPPRFINAEHLQLALVARRLKSSDVRWAAMADHDWSPRRCTWRDNSSTTLIHFPPIAGPMARGNLHRAIEQQRLTQGLPSIRKTFGTNLRSLLAEPSHFVPAAAQA